MAGWLAVQVNKAQMQRAAVAAIKAAGGTVTYDWWRDWVQVWSQTPRVEFDPPNKPPRHGPEWLRHIVGDEYFQNVVSVGIWRSKITPELISHLKNLPLLEEVVVSETVAVNDIQEQLPGIRVMSSYAKAGERYRSSRAGF